MNYHVFRKALIDRTLQTPVQTGVRLLEPLKSAASAEKIPFNILEESEMNGEPEVHRAHADLWGCLEGEAVFTCGGTLSGASPRLAPDGSPNEQELKGEKVEGGEDVTVAPGDWLWIPAGVPHQHKAERTVRMIIIKISQ